MNVIKSNKAMIMTFDLDYYNVVSVKIVNNFNFSNFINFYVRDYVDVEQIGFELISLKKYTDENCIYYFVQQFENEEELIIRLNKNINVYNDFMPVKSKNIIDLVDNLKDYSVITDIDWFDKLKNKIKKECLEFMI